MNVHIKYWPLFYTWSTRISHRWKTVLNRKKILFNLFWYLFYFIWVWMFSYLFFYINWAINIIVLIKSIFLYILSFMIFSVFYEIWYLVNDYVSKKETNPTIHIYDSIPKNFYIIQLSLRIILWSIWLFLFFLVDAKISLILFIVIFIMLIFYLLHNFIRNYFYNYMTLLWLRLMKYSLVFVWMYYILWTLDSIYYFYLTVIFMMFEFYDHTLMYNKNFWWTNKIHNWLWKHFYLSVSTLMFYFMTNDYFFLMYFILFFVLFILLTPKKNFKLCNNR